MKRIITEGALKKIIKECVNTILNEARGLQSEKLYGILQQHGGFQNSQRQFPDNWNLSKQGKHVRRKSLGGNYSNLTDNDIIGVMNRQELSNIASQSGLKAYARENGFDVPYGDTVSYSELSDGNYLIYVDRNSEGSLEQLKNNPNRKDGDWLSYYTKRQERDHNNNVDGKHTYRPMSDKAQAARDLRHNPYYWNREGGWRDAERRSQGMENVRQGNSASGGPVWRYYDGEATNDKGTYSQQYKR